MKDSPKKQGNIKNIVLIVIAVIVTIIATQNIQTVNINVLFWDLSVSLILLIGIVFAWGLIFGYIMHAVKRKKPALSDIEKTKTDVEKKKKRFFGKNKPAE